MDYHRKGMKMEPVLVVNLIVLVFVAFVILGTNKRLDAIIKIVLDLVNKRLDTANGWLDKLVNGSAKKAREELSEKVDRLIEINKENLEVQKQILSRLDKRN